MKISFSYDRILRGVEQSWSVRYRKLLVFGWAGGYGRINLDVLG